MKIGSGEQSLLSNECIPSYQTLSQSAESKNTKKFGKFEHWMYSN